MAVPKVFVSSTCYDLSEERSQLEKFIIAYGFQPILSEYSDVFYDPDEHTHNACVKEVAHCDLFILIISGRFGGKYIEGSGESITQAEYNEARRLKIPIFSFVKNDVLNAQLYYKENVKSEGKSFAEKITYPSIHKQTDAISIFNFIQSVQIARENNAIEAYSSFTDIENHLRKQWASQFYKFLQGRKDQLDVEHISIILEKLSGSSNKLESLVESLHDNNLSKDKTQELLTNAESYENTEKFWIEVKRLIDFHIDVFTTEGDLKNKAEEFYKQELPDEYCRVWSRFSPDKVIDFKEYLQSLKILKPSTNDDDDDDDDDDYIKLSIRGVEQSILHHPKDSGRISLLSQYFKSGIKNSSEEIREKAIRSVFHQTNNTLR